MASGWWDNNGAISGCVAAYQPIGAASLAASYSNLANPGTYDCTVMAGHTAPTFAAETGWTFDGGNHTLETNVTNPGAGWSCIARVTYDSAQNSMAVGIWVGWGVGYWNSNSAWIYAGGNYKFGSGGVSFPRSAVLAIAGSVGYLDGVSDCTGVTQTGYSGTVEISRHEFRLTGKVAALAIYNTTLTAGEVATLTTAMNALPVAASVPTMMQHHAAMLARG